MYEKSPLDVSKTTAVSISTMNFIAQNCIILKDKTNLEMLLSPNAEMFSSFHL